MAMNGTNVNDPSELASTGNMAVTIKLMVQFTDTAKETAPATASPGKTSPIISHGTGPSPTAKHATNPNTPAHSKIEKPSKLPNVVIDKHTKQPMTLANSNDRLPADSISQIARIVMSTFNTAKLNGIHQMPLNSSPA